jgi:thiamine pyrophosphate-dependent acetolactate synthase large subunit-like protein
MRLEEPAVDFAALARSLGVEAFGCVTSPSDLAGVYARAVARLLDGEPVLVDVSIARD